MTVKTDKDRYYEILFNDKFDVTEKSSHGDDEYITGLYSLNGDLLCERIITSAGTEFYFPADTEL